MQYHASIRILFFDFDESFLKMGAFLGDAFDEFVKEAGAMHALHAGFALLGAEELAFVFANTLG